MAGDGNGSGNGHGGPAPWPPDPYTWDPRDYGALCDKCYLFKRRVGGPVAPEINPGAAVLLLAQEPGEEECSEVPPRPYVGNAGKEMMRGLNAVGVTRNQISIDNSCSCRPENNKMDRLLHEMEKVNKKRAALGQEQFLSPHAACRPRVLRTLRYYRDVIPTGQAGLRAILQGKQSIMALRGGPIEGTIDDSGHFWSRDAAMQGHPLRVMPTLHPSFVLRARRWTKTFRVDIGKAFRWFNGTLGWVPPLKEYNPPAERIAAFLRRDVPYLAFDYETDGLEPLSANVRCLGIGTSTEAICIGFLSIDGSTRFYTPDEEDRVNQILAEWFRDKNRLKVSWNGGYYDRIKARAHLGVDPKPNLDGILLHRVVESELPHNLGYVGSVLTDIPAWKAGKKAVRTHSDEELWDYCVRSGTPVVMADGTRRPIEEIVRSRSSASVLSVKRDGTIAPAEVVGWHARRVRGQKWIAIRTEATRADERGLVVTPEHRVAVQRDGRVAWREAARVREGDLLLLPEVAFSPEQLDAIRGTLLGDSVMGVSPHCRRNAQLAPAFDVHGVHRRDVGLAQAKVAMLAPHARLRGTQPGGPVAISGRTGRAREAQRWGTRTLRQLREVYGQIYDQSGRRRLRVAVLDQLGAVGFAWWFMDDGCRQNGGRCQQNNGSRGGRRYKRDSIAICTQGFPASDVRAAAKWFSNRFGATWVGADNVLRLGVDASRAFARVVAPHVLPQLRYKLPREFDSASLPFIAPAKPQGAPTTARVVSARPYVSTSTGKQARLRDETRYCLDVEGNRNFFTAHGLVHNCLDDVAVTATVVEPLQQAAVARGQLQVAYFDHKTQLVCADMHENGMFVDQTRRREWDVQLRREAVELRKQLQALVGSSSLNPNSVNQIRDILYEQWELPVPKYSEKTHEPSTDDEAIRKLLIDKSTLPEHRRFLDALRRFRRKVKYRGTYVRKLCPSTEIIEADDLAEDEDLEQRKARLVEEGDAAGLEAEEREERKGKRGIVLLDGRLHPNWNAHGTTSGRLSSSDPNCQNFPRRLRDLIVAQPGHVLIAADLDQVELKIAAGLAGAANYLDAFRNKKDPHTMAALMVATPATLRLYEKAKEQHGEKGVKKDPDWAKVRDYQKRSQYGILYGAELETQHNTMTEVEDDNDNLIYLNLDVRETRLWRERWLAANPEFEKWWEAEILLYRKQGFLADCYIGRRRDFLDGEDRNEILNYRCQSTAVAWALRAMQDLCCGGDAPLRIGRWGPSTGPIQQGHDSLVIEAPESKGEYVAGLMTEAMTGYIPGLDVQLTAEAKVGIIYDKVTKAFVRVGTWKDV